MKVISIFGGTGFVGAELIGQLIKMPVEIRLFTRKKNNAAHLKISPNLKLFELSSKKNLQVNLDGTDVIINLVGILHEKRNTKFSMAHEDFVLNIIDSAIKKNIKRLIHVSALGTNKKAKSRYLSSKYKTENLIKKEYKTYDWTIMCPSIVFGTNDKFINLFKKIIKFLPIIFLVSPKAKFQPIHVEDLVDIIILSINNKKTYKKVLNLGGPQKFTFIEIIKLISFCYKKRNIIIGLNKTMSYLFVGILQLSPVKLITTDNLKSMETDNTVKVNDAYKFKTALKDLKTYLIHYKEK